MDYVRDLTPCCNDVCTIFIAYKQAPKFRVAGRRVREEGGGQERRREMVGMRPRRGETGVRDPESDVEVGQGTIGKKTSHIYFSP